MDAPRVIEADFASFRTVAGRKVMQLCMEVPIEKAEHALRMLGVPVPGQSKWVAIALLKEKPQASATKPSEAAATKIPFHDLPATKQAAIRCADREFRKYVAAVDGDGQFLMYDADMTADYVRQYCGVKSRADLNMDDTAERKWLELEAKYQAHLTDKKYMDVRR